MANEVFQFFSGKNETGSYARDTFVLTVLYPGLITGVGINHEAKVKGEFKPVYYGKTVGFNRIAFFRPVKTNEIRIVIESSRLKPYIEYIGVYEHAKKGSNPVPPPFVALKKAIHRAVNRRFMKKNTPSAG